QFALDKVNGLFALQQIKDSYNLTVYFRNKELYAGLAYGQQFGEVNYSLTHNVIDHDLTYRNEEDVLLKVKAVGIKRDNTKTDVEVGDVDGDLRTLHFYEVESTAELKRLAQEELQKLKYTGFEGSLNTFG